MVIDENWSQTFLWFRHGLNKALKTDKAFTINLLTITITFQGKGDCSCLTQWICCLFKYDRYHRGGDQGPSFQRLNLDIEHLDLSECNILFQITCYPLVISTLCLLILYVCTCDFLGNSFA